MRLIKRSLVNPGRRGSVRRVMARVASGELHPEPHDYAGLGEVDTPLGDGLSAGDRPTPTGTDASTPVAVPGRARGATRGGMETVEDGAQWRAVVDAMADLVAVCDARGRLTYTNPALQAVLPPARGADGSVSSGAAPLPTPLDALSLRWAALTGTQHRDVIVQLRGPDGVERRTVWTVTPVQAGDGAERGAVAVGRDVTVEQAQAQAQEDALAVTAHDLRSPLTTILGNLQLARQTVAAGAPTWGGRP